MYRYKICFYLKEGLSPREILSEKLRYEKDINREHPNALVINDKLIYLAIQRLELHPDNIKHWEMYLACDNINIVVNNYTITEQDVKIRKALDGNGTINNLFSDKADIDLNGFEIKTLQTNDCKADINDCTVKQLDFNIHYAIKKMHDNHTLEEISSDKSILVRSSIVDSINIYHSAACIKLDKTYVINFNIVNNDLSNVVIKFFSISQNSNIDILKLYSKINHLIIRDSNIEKLYFSDNSSLSKYEINKSYITKVFGCDKKVFSEIEKNEYELLKKSAINDDDEKKYYDYSYEYELLKHRKKRRFVTWYLKVSTGFSYKPLRALWFSLLIIMLFALLYSLNDFCYHIRNGGSILFDCSSIWNSIKCFLNRIFFSGITYTTLGYKTIPPMTPLTKLLSIVESTLGMINFALIVHSITTRYLKFK